MNNRFETIDASTYHLLLEKAQEMRNHPTEAESVLWNYLSGGVGGGFRKLHTIEIGEQRLTLDEYREAEKLPLVVVLDDVRSMYNVGSVFRTCDAFRVEKICLCGITSTPPHPEIHKTALGAEDSVSWQYCATACSAVEDLRKQGYTVLSVEQAEGSTPLPSFRPEKGRKYAVVLGNEVKGVHQEVIDASDGCLEIPQLGTKHSMNVSVTAGIIIYSFAKDLLL
jgi:tRNA G18 (ribose-2'-O)-methylase SpoU